MEQPASKSDNDLAVNLLIVVLLVAQVTILLISVFGDFSGAPFDPLGGANRLLQVLCWYVFSLVLGLFAALACGKRLLAVIQVVIPVCLFGGSWLISNFFQLRYDAAEYQHLVGMSAPEIAALFPDRLWRDVSPGWEGHMQDGKKN